jgi:hypothetical protein
MNTPVMTSPGVVGDGMTNPAAAATRNANAASFVASLDMAFAQQRQHHQHHRQLK